MRERRGERTSTLATVRCHTLLRVTRRFGGRVPHTDGRSGCKLYLRKQESRIIDAVVVVIPFRLHVSRLFL